MLSAIALSVVLASNASGKTVVRNHPGTVVPTCVSIIPERTNVLLRSAEINTAASWSAVAVGAAAPTITQNTSEATDPLGGNAAEKLVFPAVAAEQVSALTQSFTATATQWSSSLWFRTASGSATIYLWLWSSPTFFVVTCPVTTTWTRCLNMNRTLNAGTWAFRFGYDTRAASANTGGLAAPLTIYAYQAQAEAGWYSSPDIITAGTTITRAAKCQ